MKKGNHMASDWSTSLVLLIHFCRDKVTRQRAGEENQIGAKNKACLEYVIRQSDAYKRRSRRIFAGKQTKYTWYGSQMHTKDKRQRRRIFAGKQTKQIQRHVRNWKCTIVKCQRKLGILRKKKQRFTKIIAWCNSIVCTSMWSSMHFCMKTSLFGWGRTYLMKSHLYRVCRQRRERHVWNACSAHKLLLVLR